MTNFKIDNMKKQQLLDIPVEDVAKKLGLRVQRHHALCFMHDDHHPSLVFFPSTNKWKCYVCNVWGDNISLVMKYNNQSFVEACVWLGREFNVDLGGTDSIDINIHRREIPKAKTEEKIVPDLEILQYIVENNGLTENARKFLFDERGYSEETVEKLRICAIDNEEEFVNSLIRKFGEKRVLKCQLAYKHGYKYVSYFHAPCVFFPYYDANNQLVGLQARYLGSVDQHQRFQFPKGTSTHIFNLPVLAELKQNEPLFVSEGVTDAIALMSVGYKAVAIPSATLLKSDELKVVASHPLLMYPDNDEPGYNLFSLIDKNISQLGGNVTKLLLPANCKDFSEFFIRNRCYAIQDGKPEQSV